MVARQEKTFILIKPDGVQRGLVGEIIKRFENKGYKLVAMKMLMADNDILNSHYAEHKERPFFGGLVKYMISGPVVAMIWEGVSVVEAGRKILGKTNPIDSYPGTIRGDYAIMVGRNICHGSDSVDSANREIKLWFSESEILCYGLHQDEWVYE